MFQLFFLLEYVYIIVIKGGFRMYHFAEVLDEVIEFAKAEKEKGNEGTIYMQEKEVSPAGDLVLGDEDTGDKFEEEIRLLLETSENAVYYEDSFQEMFFYEQALEQVETLKTYYPAEWLSEKKIKEKQEKLSAS